MVFTIVAFHGFIIFHGVTVPSVFTVVFAAVTEACPVTSGSVISNAEMDLFGDIFYSPEATFFKFFWIISLG